MTYMFGDLKNNNCYRGSRASRWKVRKCIHKLRLHLFKKLNFVRAGKRAGSWRFKASPSK
jgi:hypothetical protein